MSDMDINPIVRQVVNRLHVGTRNTEVLRYLRSRLSDEGRAPGNWPRRKLFYRQALEQHRRNRRDYAAVMGGNLAGYGKD